MPITPLHLGPGILFKLTGGPHLSLMLFTLAQITMDIEVLLRLLLGISPLHGFSNTIAGATAVLIVTLVPGKPACEWVLRWWNHNLTPGQARWLQARDTISWQAAALGGSLGVYSHFILDAMMHADAKPWHPFSEKNPFVGLISIQNLTLTLACAICLFTGTIVAGGYRLVKVSRATLSNNNRP